MIQATISFTSSSSSSVVSARVVCDFSVYWRSTYLKKHNPFIHKYEVNHELGHIILYDYPYTMLISSIRCSGVIYYGVVNVAVACIRSSHLTNTQKQHFSSLSHGLNVSSILLLSFLILLFTPEIRLESLKLHPYPMWGFVCL